jgi:hypothetical protein
VVVEILLLDGCSKNPIKKLITLNFWSEFKTANFKEKISAI